MVSTLVVVVCSLNLAADSSHSLNFFLDFQQKLVILTKTAILCAISWVGFLVVQAYGYSLYCSEDHSNVYMRPWCLAKPPLVYTFVQSFYW